MTVEKQVYVVPSCEVIYVRMDMNFTQSQSQEEQPIDGHSY